MILFLFIYLFIFCGYLFLKVEDNEMFTYWFSRASPSSYSDT